jgi:hypothetical protein
MAVTITVRRLVPVDASFKAPRSAKVIGKAEIIGDGTKKLVTMRVDADEWERFKSTNPDGLGFPDFPGAGPLDASR